MTLSWSNASSSTKPNQLITIPGPNLRNIYNAGSFIHFIQENNQQGPKNNGSPVAVGQVLDSRFRWCVLGSPNEAAKKQRFKNKEIQKFRSKEAAPLLSIHKIGFPLTAKKAHIHSEKEREVQVGKRARGEEEKSDQWE